LINIQISSWTSKYASMSVTRMSRSRQCWTSPETTTRTALDQTRLQTMMGMRRCKTTRGNKIFLMHLQQFEKVFTLHMGWNMLRRMRKQERRRIKTKTLTRKRRKEDELRAKRRKMLKQMISLSLKGRNTARCLMDKEWNDHSLCRHLIFTSTTFLVEFRPRTL